MEVYVRATYAEQVGRVPRERPQLCELAAEAKDGPSLLRSFRLSVEVAESGLKSSDCTLDRSYLSNLLF